MCHPSGPAIVCGPLMLVVDIVMGIVTMRWELGLQLDSGGHSKQRG